MALIKNYPTSAGLPKTRRTNLDVTSSGAHVSHFTRFATDLYQRQRDIRLLVPVHPETALSDIAGALFVTSFILGRREKNFADGRNGAPNSKTWRRAAIL